ncbi:DUF5368 domain-containing protein [Castellaniella sp. GW247-6E4]|uniref:DUF5368 domain-containing protein n=1 Tax=Castellaniella sp. GW247-6E4 TaxID=3140380 RepID=UPI0033150155
MDTIDPLTLIAILREMLNVFLWPLLGFGLLAPLLFAVAAWRERGLQARRMIWSQALGLVGGAAALVLMVQVSSSGFTDAGGPIDWLLILLIFALGMLWTVFAVYGIITIAEGRRHRARSLE